MSRIHSKYRTMHNIPCPGIEMLLFVWLFGLLSVLVSDFWRFIIIFKHHICPSEILNCLPKIPVNRNVAFCVIILDFYLLWYLTFGRFTTIFEQFIRFSEVLNILHKIHMNRNVAFCVIILDLYLLWPLVSDFYQIYHDFWTVHLILRSFQLST